MFVKVLKALQDAVTNHNLAAQPNPQVPEPTAGSGNAKSSTRQLPVHSFQVSQWRPTAQTRSIWSFHHTWPSAVFQFLRWRWWDPADRQCLWMWTLECCSLTRRPQGPWAQRGSHTTEVGQDTLLVRAWSILMPCQDFNWLACSTSVLQIIKFQSSPAKVHVVVDSSHNPPWEMTFESTRVGGVSPARWNQLLPGCSLTRQSLCVSETRRLLPTAPADEGQTLPAERAWHDLCVCGHLEHG